MACRRGTQETRPGNNYYEDFVYLPENPLFVVDDGVREGGLGENPTFRDGDVLLTEKAAGKVATMDARYRGRRVIAGNFCMFGPKVGDVVADVVADGREDLNVILNPERRRGIAPSVHGKDLDASEVISSFEERPGVDLRFIELTRQCKEEVVKRIKEPYELIDVFARRMAELIATLSADEAATIPLFWMDYEGNPMLGDCEYSDVDSMTARIVKCWRDRNDLFSTTREGVFHRVDNMATHFAVRGMALDRRIELVAAVPGAIEKLCDNPYLSKYSLYAPNCDSWEDRHGMKGGQVDHYLRELGQRFRIRGDVFFDDVYAALGLYVGSGNWHRDAFAHLAAMDVRRETKMAVKRGVYKDLLIYVRGKTLVVRRGLVMDPDWSSGMPWLSGKLGDPDPSYIAFKIREDALPEIIERAGDLVANTPDNGERFGFFKHAGLYRSAQETQYPFRLLILQDSTHALRPGESEPELSFSVRDRTRSEAV